MSLVDLTPGKLRVLKAVSGLLEDPSAKVTISRIAKSIHVTDAAIYRHYKSKEEIFTSLMGYMETNLLGPLNIVQQESQTTAERVSGIFEQYSQFLEGHPGFSRLFLGYGGHEAKGMSERLKLLHAKIRAQLAQILRWGQAKGEMAPGIEPEHATEFLYGLIVAEAMAQAYDFPQVDVQERWQLFEKTMLSV